MRLVSMSAKKLNHPNLFPGPPLPRHEISAGVLQAVQVIEVKGCRIYLFKALIAPPHPRAKGVIFARKINLAFRYSGYEPVNSNFLPEAVERFDPGVVTTNARVFALDPIKWGRAQAAIFTGEKWEIVWEAVRPEHENLFLVSKRLHPYARRVQGKLF